jgi:YVTN family beta-propeller protein
LREFRVRVTPGSRGRLLSSAGAPQPTQRLGRLGLSGADRRRVAYATRWRLLLSAAVLALVASSMLMASLGLSGALSGSGVTAGRAGQWRDLGHPFTAQPIALGRFTIAPSAGVVGTTIAANGSGFAAYAGVSFDIAGVPSPSSCGADVNGTFPGASGTPCTFRVPDISPGVKSLSAFPTPENSSVSSAPVAVEADPSTGQIFVANEASDTVTVLNGSNSSTTASINVGSFPDAIAVDSYGGQVFVADGGSNQVSVISAGNDSLLRTITVGSSPTALAFDSVANEVFVADSGADNVSIIQAANDSVVATVAVGADPVAVGVDAAVSQVFVVNRYTNNVTVIQASNDSFNATVAVGITPDAVAVDPTTGQVFIANNGSNTVSVLLAWNDSLNATIPVGGIPDAVDVDSATGHVFVANSLSYTVSEITESNDSVNMTISVGNDPVGVTDDPYDAAVYVVNAQSDDVSILSATNGSLLATMAVGANPRAAAPGNATQGVFIVDAGSASVSTLHVDPLEIASFTVIPFHPRLTLSPASGAVGSNVSANGTGFGVNISVLLGLSGIPLAPACHTDTSGSFPGTSGSSCTFSVPDVPVGTPDVVAGGDWIAATYAAGVQPQGIAFDPGSGQTFVADDGPCGGYCAGTVTVLNDTTGAVSATVPVQDWPTNLVDDPHTGQIFAANTISGTISVISARNDSLVTTIGVGADPWTLADDPSTAQVFVGNFYSGNVSVIDASNDSVVANVNVGLLDYGVVDDPVGQLVFVSNWIGSVSIISTLNDSLVATVGVGGTPLAATLDPSTDQIFVVNSASENLSVISLSNDSVVATIVLAGAPGAGVDDPTTAQVFVPVDDYGSATPWGLQIVSAWTDSTVGIATSNDYLNGPMLDDPTTGQIVVLGGLDNAAYVFSAWTDSFVASVPVGAYPWALTEDTSTDQVQVANINSNNVSVVAMSASAGFRVTSAPAPALEIAPAEGVVGSQLAADGTGFAPNHLISFTIDGRPAESTCRADLNGNFPGVSHAGGCTFVVPPAPAGAEVVSASDGSKTANATVDVRSLLRIPSQGGPAGGNVSASGLGFAADSAITFYFDGSVLNSSCRTDPNGSFPGSSDTGCRLTIPSAAVGRHTLEASDGVDSSSVAYVVTTLTVSPVGGEAGSSVNASGAGFSSNSTIVFTVGGAGTSSVCRTNASGDFGSGTGLPCRFVVPFVPGGPESVTAGTSPPIFSESRLDVGAQPGAMADDVATGQVFVVDSGDNNVSVISTATNSLAATVAVGVDPVAVAVDLESGEVFVANAGSDNVSVISAYGDGLIATIGVGSDPDAVAFDPATDQVFVANAGSNTTSVIRASTDSVVATVAVGEAASAVAVDPTVGQVFVVDSSSNNISVISTRTDSLLTTVAVGSDPEALALDPATGQVFVTNSNSNNISVILVSNDSVVATIGVAAVGDAIADDPITGQLFVGGYTQSDVWVISAATDSMVGAIPIPNGGVDVSAVADDPATGQIFAGVWGYNATVFVLSSLNDTIEATVTGDFGETSAFAVDPSSGEILLSDAYLGSVTILAPGAAETLGNRTGGGASVTVSANMTDLTPSGTSGVDIGQNVSLIGWGFGPSVTIRDFTLGGTDLTCTSSTEGSCNAGVIVTDARGSFAVTVTVPDVAPGAYNVTIADSSGDEAELPMNVSALPVLGALTSSAASVDLGQYVTFQVGRVSAGSDGLEYDWSGLPRGCLTEGASVFCTPTSTGTFAVSVTATDSNGGSATSGPLSFTVWSDPTVQRPTATPASGQLDAGQTVSFSALATMGTGMYSAFSWTGLPGGCANITTARVTCSGVDLLSGNYSISATVTDSNGETSLISPALAFYIRPDPQVALPIANRTSLDVGQTVSISDSSLGLPPFVSFDWDGLPAGCGSPTGLIVTCTASAPGTYAVRAEATDSYNFTAQSPALSITVYSDPSISLSANRTSLDVGQSIMFDAPVSGGSGGDLLAWSGAPPGCQPEGTVFACVVSMAGPSLVSVQVTDSNGITARAESLLITVGSRVSASISIGSTEATVHQPVEMNATGSGGVGSLSYQWVFGDGGTGTGSSVTHQFGSAGSFTVTVWVNDTVGGSARVSSVIDVSSEAARETPPAPRSGADDEVVLAAAAIVVILGGIGAVALWSRYRRGRKDADATGVTGEEPVDASEGAGVDASDGEPPSEAD